jgi:hypothetical protein
MLPAPMRKPKMQERSSSLLNALFSARRVHNIICEITNMRSHVCPQITCSSSRNFDARPADKLFNNKYWLRRLNRLEGRKIRHCTAAVTSGEHAIRVGFAAGGSAATTLSGIAKHTSRAAKRRK